MKQILFTLAAGSSLIAVPAMAQTAGPAVPFSGFHVEGLVGYDMARAGSTADDDSDADNDQSIDGLLYGVGAGYDFNLGKLIVGPEAEVSWSTGKTGFDEGDFEGFGVGNVRTNRDLYVGGRVGVAVMPSTMAYAKGGYTNAKFDVRNSIGTVVTNTDIDSDGWRLGAGLEQQLGTNMFAKVEYRYSNYKKGELDYTGDAEDGERFDLDLDRHQVVAGVGLRF